MVTCKWRRVISCCWREQGSAHQPVDLAVKRWNSMICRLGLHSWSWSCHLIVLADDSPDRRVHEGFVATAGVPIVTGAGGATCKVVDFFLVGSTSHDCSSSLCHHLILADGSLSLTIRKVVQCFPCCLSCLAGQQWLESRLLVLFFPVFLVLSTMLFLEENPHHNPARLS